MPLCPRCEGPPEIMYVRPTEDERFPAVVQSECASCGREWSALVTAEELLRITELRGIPIDWSPDWPPA